MNNSELLNQFYQSFSKGDAEGMIQCYHESIIFQDPAFGILKGDRAKNMWRMLLSRNSDITISYDILETSANSGSVAWIAKYDYGLEKRKVCNKVLGKFQFKDGKIIKHTDSFDLWKWSRQALGLSGYILGWTALMRIKIQQKTKKLLDNFIEKRILSQ